MNIQSKDATTDTLQVLSAERMMIPTIPYNGHWVCDFGRGGMMVAVLEMTNGLLENLQ